MGLGISRTMGSYVLVSYQSQTCSSHCTESCITTRTPWLGRSTGSPREGRPEPAQPSGASPEKNVSRSRQCTAGRNWRILELLLEVGKGSGMQRVKALQEDVDDKKAELETRLYVGYIGCMYTTILSIPRMQINHILA